MDKRAFVIFNPASGRGRGARRMDGLLDLLGKHLPGFEHAVTEQPGEESLLADQALADGRFDLIVAVGGDGTWSNVANQVVAYGMDDVAFGLLATGTGNDFGRNFGLSGRDHDAAVRILAEGKVRTVDVGRVVTQGTPVGAQADVLGPGEGRHFLNLIGFGFDVAVIEDAARARFLRGAVLYKVTALKNLFSFPGIDLEVTSEDGRVRVVSGGGTVAGFETGPLAQLITSAIVVQL